MFSKDKNVLFNNSFKLGRSKNKKNKVKIKFSFFFSLLFCVYVYYNNNLSF